MLRRVLSVMVCLFWLLPWASQAENPKAGCYDKAQTQLELNDCAGEELAAADAELNRVYQAILKKYKDDSRFIEKLRAAQRAWLAFRDAEFEAKFPASDGYGSIFPMCAAQYKAQLTRERVTRLREWLDGIEEGDACSGSVGLKGE
jgi:uncharacterized protein YecT (DUF1311 family)